MHPRRAPRGKPIRLLCACIVESICSRDDDSPHLRDRYALRMSRPYLYICSCAWEVRSLSRNETTGGSRAMCKILPMRTSKCTHREGNGKKRVGLAGFRAKSELVPIEDEFGAIGRRVWRKV